MLPPGPGSFWSGQSLQSDKVRKKKEIRLDFI